MANPPLDRCHKVENWSNLKLIIPKNLRNYVLPFIKLPIVFTTVG